MKREVFGISVLVFITAISMIMRPGAEKEGGRIRQECTDFGSFVIDGAKYECSPVGRSGGDTEMTHRERSALSRRGQAGLRTWTY